MSRLNRILVMALGGGCLCMLTAKAQTPRLPVYQVGRTSGPTKIDGRLDDTAWKKAARFLHLRLIAAASLLTGDVRSL